MDVIDWLLDSDPAIRWQVMRDLTDAGPAEIAAERARIPHEGLGGDAGVTPDERVDAAVHHVEGKRQADGTWLLDGEHGDALDFPLGESVGAPSRWTTLRALRVLRWYEGSRR